MPIYSGFSMPNVPKNASRATRQNFYRTPIIPNSRPAVLNGQLTAINGVLVLAMQWQLTATENHGTHGATAHILGVVALGHEHTISASCCRYPLLIWRTLIARPPCFFCLPSHPHGQRIRQRTLVTHVCNYRI